MSDASVNLILEGLQGEKQLESISLKDCHLREKSMEQLYKILERPYPNNILEIKIDNIKELD